MPVSLVLGKLAGGMSIDEVMYEYYLSIEEIRAALDLLVQEKKHRHWSVAACKATLAML